MLTEEPTMSVKNIFLETRPQFLLLSPILVFLGMGIALYGGSFNTLYFVLSIIGLVLLHASVNTLNDYNDFKTGVDLKTNRTPFSGGSGFLPAGLLKPSTVLALGLATFFLAVPIGIFFLFKLGWDIAPLFIIGAVFVLFYTSHLTRIVLGTFIIINGGFTYGALYASIPSGFLVFSLLLLNEFPDAEADKIANRKTLPIILGHRGAAVVYSTLVIATYLWIVLGVILNIMPVWTLLALLTLPVGIKAIKGSLTYKTFEELIPAQGANVMIVLGIQYVLANVI
jgi:1,4-dihydroxy-2-naphthoate octaprenyltransferase